MSTVDGIISLIWGLIVGSVILAGSYMIGLAIHDNDVKNQKFQIECIQAGGHMEIIGNGNTSIVCQKR